MPTSPPLAPAGPPPIHIPGGCETKLTGEWQLEDDPSFRYHFEDDGSEATVWVYRVFAPPDAGALSRLFPRVLRDGGPTTLRRDGGTAGGRDAGILKDGGVDLVALHFIAADELFAKESYEEAAKTYVDLAGQEPKRDFAPTALNNAAVAYEKARRFADALALDERIVREYSKSKLADGALFRLAVNAEHTSDFNKAAESYQKLLKDYPLSKDRETAMFNLGVLLEGTNKYQEAAAVFQRYVETFPKSAEAPKTQLRVAEIYEKQKDFNQELAALNALILKFGAGKTQSELIVVAKQRIADAYLQLNKEPEAKKALAAAADEFTKRALNPAANPIAADAAAWCGFQLAEYDLREFEKLKISGSGKASFAAKDNAAKRAQVSFEKVLKFDRPQWSTMALYKKSDLLERFGQAILDEPVPPEVMKLGAEAVGSYQDQRLALRVDLEDRAVSGYLMLAELARRRSVSNEWSQKGAEALHRLRPGEYPSAAEAADPADAGPPDGGTPDAGPIDAGSVDAGQEPFDAGPIDVTHHHPLPPDLVPRDGGNPLLASAVIHLRRGPDGFLGEAETLHLLPSGRECRATFPTRIGACGPFTLTLVSAASTPVGDGCQTPASPRPAAQLEHRLARTDAGEL